MTLPARVSDCIQVVRSGNTFLSVSDIESYVADRQEPPNKGVTPYTTVNIT